MRRIYVWEGESTKSGPVDFTRAVRGGTEKDGHRPGALESRANLNLFRRPFRFWLLEWNIPVPVHTGLPFRTL
jgi:hypothetical protein